MYVIVNTIFRKYKIILNIIFRDKQNFNKKHPCGKTTFGNRRTIFDIYQSYIKRTFGVNRVFLKIWSIFCYLFI